MKNKKIIILGAGPAGLAAAWKLSIQGVRVEVLELESQVGGLCRSIRRGGFTFDLGGHRFITKDDDLLEQIKVLMGNDLLFRSRKSVVRLQGKYFRYPLGGKDLLSKMNPLVAARCFLDYLFTTVKNKIIAPRDISFEDWVVNRFGRSLYNIYFGPYSTKLWGVHPTTISANWAAQRISLLNLWDVFLRLFGKTKDVPNTYALKFYYPKKGIGQIPERMAEAIEANGGTIRLETEVKSIKMGSKRIEEITYLEGGTERSISGDWIISTIPLPGFIHMITPRVDDKYIALANSMKFRSIRFLNLLLDDKYIGDNTWIYIPEAEYFFFRIQEPKNWSLANVPEGKTSLILEIACNEGDEPWNASDEEIYARCIEDLHKLRLPMKHEHVFDYFSTKIKHAYPIYDLDYKNKVSQVLKWLMEINNLVAIGRQGLYRYSNMDHSIKMGILASQHILEGLPKKEILKVASGEVAFELDR